MPQLEKGEAKFKFRQINVDDAFTKAKTDMIYSIRRCTITRRSKRRTWT